MIFASKAFLIFLPIVLMIYHSLRSRSSKYTFLLIASWLFYAWWSTWYTWVLLFTTLVDYQAGRLIESAADDLQKRRWVAVSVIVNLGLLAFFKYANFVLGNTLALGRLCGYDLPDRVLNIVLPLGISFHTFQGISYTVDVYRGHIRAVRCFRDFALFVAFFPQMAAGPIVRAVEFLPQMVTPPRVSSALAAEGLHWFLLGMAKKLLLADRLDEFVSPVFAQPELYDMATLRWAALAWVAQIYCDFSGYSDMAVGCGKWFGFELPRNFNFPYLATNIADFWRRWHLSLSTWLRDYLYFPLGGSRCGPVRVAGNLMLTFFLCGLWHGATWFWVVYGVLQGTLMIAHRQYDQFLKRREWAESLRATLPYRCLAFAVTFYFITASMLFVHATSWYGLWLMQQALLGIGSSGTTAWLPAYVPLMVLMVAIGHAYTGLRGSMCRILDWPAPARGLAYVGMLASVVVFHPGVGKSFIYFHF